MTSAIDYWNLALTGFTVVFSGVTVVITAGILAENRRQNRLIAGTDPVFEASIEPMDGQPGWYVAHITVHNRSPATIDLVGVTVPLLSRSRLLAMERGEIPIEPDPSNAARSVPLDFSALPLGKSLEIGGRTWRGDSTETSVFVWKPPKRLYLLWRSRSDNRLRKSRISLPKLR